MIKRYVASYVNRLTKEDMTVFLESQHLYLSDQEKDFCFSYIKKNWPLIFSDQDKIFKDLKANLTHTTYNQLEPILLFYQNKYQSYL